METRACARRLMVAQADVLPFAPGCLGLALPGHLVQCILQTVEVVGVQKRKIKFLSMDEHSSVLLSVSPATAVL